MSPVVIALIAVVVFLTTQVGPAIYPERIAKRITIVLGGAALFVSTADVPVSPAAYADFWPAFAAAFLVFAIAPPLLGLVESRRRPDGEAVFSTGRVAGTTNRLPGHLIGNLLGALIATGFLVAAASMPGVHDFIEDYRDSVALNIALPVAGFVVYLFVRAQQTDACPDIDERVKNDDAWERGIVGFSLSHWHQVANVVHLIVCTFAVSTTVLYLFAFTIQRSGAGTPLGLSWQLATAMVAVLLFVLWCGVPVQGPDRAVYFTFLTGTPAVLVAILVWFAMLEDGVKRDTTAFAILGSGYAAYCVLAVLGERRRGNFQWHYFTGLVLAFLLAVLLTLSYRDA